LGDAHTSTVIVPATRYRRRPSTSAAESLDQHRATDAEAVGSIGARPTSVYIEGIVPNFSRRVGSPLLHSMSRRLPRLCHEWAQTASNELVCRASPFRMQLDRSNSLPISCTKLNDTPIWLRGIGEKSGMPATDNRCIAYFLLAAWQLRRGCSQAAAPSVAPGDPGRGRPGVPQPRGLLVNLTTASPQWFSPARPDGVQVDEHRLGTRTHEVARMRLAVGDSRLQAADVGGARWPHPWPPQGHWIPPPGHRQESA
jgi:hypothetical protein